MKKIIDKINSPMDVKALDVDQLPTLAREIRKYLIDVVSENGGHLSSNLGVVELTIALHYCFDSPVDKIVWDVGHQSYVHKILTGRRDELRTIRKYGGLSGFPKREESIHDIYNTGHSSTSISAALGLAVARDLKNERNYILPIIGDGALTGGLAFEALNNASRLKSNFIVILNDNQMSISENVGGISQYLDTIRTANLYQDVKEDVQNLLRRIPKYGEGVINAVRDVKDSVKQLFIPGMFFEEMGFTYLGPIDGHNIKQMITMFNRAKRVEGPTIIHLNTVKGKGYKPAEAFPAKFHGIKPFEKETGHIKEGSKGKSFSKIFGDTLVELGRKNNRIAAITAAMPEGTGLLNFSKEFPERYFDVGIAEQHAVVFAGGLAVSGYKPFVAIYSSFLQRAYDQVLHDICLQNLPVVFGIDRSGLVGEDGETHQGIFDTSFLNHIPNMTVMAPRNGEELKAMVEFSASYNEGPISIKYPRGTDSTDVDIPIQTIEPFYSETLFDGEKIALISVGSMFNEAYKIYHLLKEDGHNPTLVNARFIKPIDLGMIDKILKNHDKIIIIEENVLSGGFGSEVIRLAQDFPETASFLLVGIDDEFIKHGSREKLLEVHGLDALSIYNRVKAFLKNDQNKNSLGE